VSVRIEDDVFYVHAITRRSSADLAGPKAGEMERWVAWVEERYCSFCGISAETPF
jgi:hypothetical protein